MDGTVLKTTSKLIDQVDELKRNYDRTMQDILIGMRDNFHNMFRNLFSICPDVRSISWDQNPSEYNDSTYEFSASCHGDEFEINGELFDDLVCDEKLGEQAKAVQHLLLSLSEDDLEMLFRHARVTVTPTALHVKELSDGRY